MGPVRAARQAFPPLDEELGLQPGSLTPLQLEHLVRLGLWMPFPKAAHLLADRMGVQISEATGRRQTEAAGAAYEQGQDEQASQLLEAKNKQSNKSTGCSSKPKKSKAHPEQIKLLISSDGAKVGLLKGEWAEIKTRVIGQVKAKEQHGKQRTEQVVE